MVQDGLPKSRSLGTRRKNEIGISAQIFSFSGRTERLRFVAKIDGWLDSWMDLDRLMDR